MIPVNTIRSNLLLIMVLGLLSILSSLKVPLIIPIDMAILRVLSNWVLLGYSEDGDHACLVLVLLCAAL